MFGDVPATARWMVNMNFLIHSLMYSYYACKAFRIVIPRAVNVSITSLQIIQMLYGLWINIRVVHFKLTEQPCDAHLSVALTGLSLYGLFFILFVNFFIRSYLLKPKTKSMYFSCGAGLDSNLTKNNSPAVVDSSLLSANGSDIKLRKYHSEQNNNKLETNAKKTLWIQSLIKSIFSNFQLNWIFSFEIFFYCIESQK